MALAFGSCSKDNPFGDEPVAQTGRLLTTSLSVSLETNGGPRDLRTGLRKAAPAPAEFTVDFIKDGEVVSTYKYADMPEIVVLPVGNYVAKAYHGENLDAAWEAPYYEGVSQEFEIIADDITDDVQPIVCKLQNVRVSVNFEQKLRDVMGDDCKVTVVVGDKGTLDFTVADVDRSGYFAFVEDSHTLAATFNGTVDGAYTTETKSYDNVQPATHYSITFRLHDAGEEDPGQIGGDDIIIVDAEVESTDMNRDVTTGDVTLTDDRRPQEGEEKPDPTPSEPDDPSAPAPVIAVESPYTLDKENDLIDGTPLVITVSSSAQGGITGFLVQIISDTLTPEVLEDVNLTDKLDLVNPGQYEQGLTELSLPVKDQVEGASKVNFVISDDFITLMKLLGEGRHQFVLTVTDANGTTVKTVKAHTII